MALGAVCRVATYRDRGKGHELRRARRNAGFHVGGNPRSAAGPAGLPLVDSYRPARAVRAPASVSTRCPRKRGKPTPRSASYGLRYAPRHQGDTVTLWWCPRSIMRSCRAACSLRFRRAGRRNGDALLAAGPLMDFTPEIAEHWAALLRHAAPSGADDFEQ